MPLANRPILFLAILLVIVGVQFVTMGLLAELQTRIYHESQKRPTYTVRETLGTLTMKYRAIKGTRDILPAETPRWQRVERLFREAFARYGYSEIRAADLRGDRRSSRAASATRATSSRRRCTPSPTRAATP